MVDTTNRLGSALLYEYARVGGFIVLDFGATWGVIRRRCSRDGADGLATTLRRAPFSDLLVQPSGE